MRPLTFYETAYFRGGLISQGLRGVAVAAGGGECELLPRNMQKTPQNSTFNQSEWMTWRQETVCAEFRVDALCYYGD
ncbi:MAG: hypothetical protein AAF456_19245 [Planctomycetota bacterium]